MPTWLIQAGLYAARSPVVRRLVMLAVAVSAVSAVLGVVMFGSLIGLLVGSDQPAAAAGTACVGGGSAAVDPIAGTSPTPTPAPGLVAGVNAEQQDAATQIIAVGQRLRVPDYGLVVAIATARQESSILPLTYGDRDSLGPFQQRANWGPAAERINPTTSAMRFFNGGDDGSRGLLDVPDWQSMPVTVAAQTVQISGYPDAYADDEAPARAIVAALLDRALTVVATGACTVGPVQAAIPGTSCPDSGLAVERGLTPSALQVLRCVHAAWPSQITAYGGVGQRAANPFSDHPAGRAVDAMIPGWDTPAGKALGDAAAAYLQASAAALNVRYIIWSARIWAPDRAAEGWRPYRHPSGATDPTSLHMDHVHVSVLP